MYYLPFFIGRILLLYYFGFGVTYMFLYNLSHKEKLTYIQVLKRFTSVLGWIVIFFIVGVICSAIESVILSYLL